MEKGKLIIVSGFSGVGKGTVIKNLMNRHPEKYAFSISATTRKPRPGEENGREYYFVSRAEFISMIEDKELLEHAEYSGNFYGTPASPIEKLLNEGKNIILDIEVKGMKQVKAMRPETITVFIIPPSAEELIKRLNNRGTETEEQIMSRLTKATEEGVFASEYDCIICNEDVEQTTDTLEMCISEGSQSPSEKEKNINLSREICECINKRIK